MARHQQAPLRRFERMSRLKDYSVQKGLTDPRGWKVVDGAGQEVGQVRDLVIDTDRMAAAYLEVELDSRSFGHEDPIILVPMTRADRDGDRNRLVVRDLTRSRIAALFDERAAHEASFWERWWSEPAPEQRPVAALPEEQRPRAVPRPIDPLDADRPHDVTLEPPVSRRPGERIAAHDVSAGRPGLPADVPSDPVRQDERFEVDPLEDPQYRRPLDPGDRRRFDE